MRRSPLHDLGAASGCRLRPEPRSDLPRSGRAEARPTAPLKPPSPRLVSMDITRLGIAPDDSTTVQGAIFASGGEEVSLLVAPTHGVNRGDISGDRTSPRRGAVRREAGARLALQWRSLPAAAALRRSDRSELRRGPPQRDRHGRAASASNGWPVKKVCLCTGAQRPRSRRRSEARSCPPLPASALRRGRPLRSARRR